MIIARRPDSIAGEVSVAPRAGFGVLLPSHFPLQRHRHCKSESSGKSILIKSQSRATLRIPWVVALVSSTDDL